jgi:hypothetical protein
MRRTRIVSSQCRGLTRCSAIVAVLLRTAHAAAAPPTIEETKSSTTLARAPSALETDGAAQTGESLSPPAQIPTADELEARNLLLRAHIRAYVREANMIEGIGYFSAGLAAFGLYVGARAWGSDPGIAAAWTVGFGASTLAFGASLGASRDTRVDVLTTLGSFNGGVAMLGLAVTKDPGALPRLSVASASGAFFVLAVFDAVNALTRESKLSTLRRERDQLDTGDVGMADLRTIESNFIGTDVPFGPGLHAAPLGVGGLVAFVPVLDGHYTKQQQTAAAIMGSVLSLTAILTALTPNRVASYKDDLKSTGLSLMASPTNIGLRYRF